MSHTRTAKPAAATEIPARLRLLTVAQVAASLAVCRHTVRRWIARGHFPGAIVLPGGDVRVPLAELERFQQRQALAFLPELAA